MSYTLYIMTTSVQNVIKEAEIQIFFVCCFVTIVSIVFTGDEVDYLVVSDAEPVLVVIWLEANLKNVAEVPRTRNL